MHFAYGRNAEAGPPRAIDEPGGDHAPGAFDDPCRVAQRIARLRSRADDDDAAAVVERHGAVGEHAPLRVQRQDERSGPCGRPAACASSSALQASSQPRASRNTRSSAKPISEIVMIDAYMSAV